MNQPTLNWLRFYVGLLAVGFVLDAATIALAVPAFPGAEGGGANASGGRGGRVIAVTNLNDKGPGSLRDAVAADGPRTIVFRVAGNIELASPLRIRGGDLTIAGQTAPGGGICLKNYGITIKDAKNVIIRYLRLRPGDSSGNETDALSAGRCRDIIIDHCSASWGSDECLSVYDGENLTVQWCIVSEGLYQSVHHKGQHGYGGIWGGTSASFYHNLLAHQSSRNPRIAPNSHNVDCRNNVIFNWGFNSAYGGEAATANLVNNYYKAGPATSEKCRGRILAGDGAGGRWYLDGNFVDGFQAVSADNWQGVHKPYADRAKMQSVEPFPCSPATTHSAEEAYTLVLERAGATLPRRDAVDERVVREARAGSTEFGETYRGGKKGIIDSQTTVGGWPALRSAEPPADADGDGMPDDWEANHRLKSNDSADGSQDADRDGYTNLEEYLNQTDPGRTEAAAP